MTAMPFFMIELLIMDLRRSKYILPNLFTLASLFFGTLAVVACFERLDDGFRRAAVAILIAMLADALDGRVARMTRTETRFGVQLDSLADLVSFGVAPAVMAYAFALHGLDAVNNLLGPLVAFLYVACGAMRLARFNLMANAGGAPSPFFQGLPIPAAAGLISLAVWMSVDLAFEAQTRLILLVVGLPLLGLLMVSTIRYRSFKHIRMGIITRITLLLLLAGVIFLAWQTRTSVVLLSVSVVYVMLGPVEWLVRRVQRLKRPSPTR